MQCDFTMAVSSVRRVIQGCSAVAVATLLYGCATQVPLISHTHVGHSLTGWVDTPGQVGLFETSEEFAARILKVAERATENAADGDQSGVARRMQELDSLIGLDDADSSDAYNFLRAFNGARQHIEFAVLSDDVSPNLKSAGELFLSNSEGVLDRAEILQAVAQTKIDSSTYIDVANEVYSLARQTFDGEDLDGNGVIGADEYGLKQLREELSVALQRESDPAYRPVEQKYLFGLVRLPDGTWKFRSVREEVDGGGTY